MLSLQSILLDWGWISNAHVWMDTTAGIAIGSQQGLGRVKHIDTVFLLVQAMVTEGKISLGKMPTKEMLADFVTKHVDAANDAELHGWIGYEVPVGSKQADSERVITFSRQRRLLCRDVEIGYQWFWKCELRWLFWWNWKHTSRRADGI